MSLHYKGGEGIKTVPSPLPLGEGMGERKKEK